MPPRGPNKEASAGTSIGLERVDEANVNAVTGNIPEVPVQVMKGPECTQQKKWFTQPAAIASPTKSNAHSNNVVKPLTPIFVCKLEDFLAEHPDPTLVSQLCTNLREGARIGFEGQRTPGFQKICLLPLPNRIL